MSAPPAVPESQCFLPGTLILTPQGPVFVEALAVGVALVPGRFDRTTTVYALRELSECIVMVILSYHRVTKL